MKRISLICFLSAINLLGITQTIAKAHFNVSARSGEISSASLFIGDWLFEINRNGDLQNYDYLPGGEISYYDQFDGTDKEGKIKSIGGVKIDYYDQFDSNEKLGKLKSIGNRRIDYYDRFDDNDMLGKVKIIGDVKFEYYSKFDDTDQFKKLKTIGSIKINYYDKFGDDTLIGFVKSISNVQLKYYDHFSVSKRRGVKSIEGNTRNVYVAAWY